MNRELNKFKKIKPHDAIKHPKWKMEKNEYRLINSYEQILELIEAQKLFNIDSNKFEILIHPNP